MKKILDYSIMNALGRASTGVLTKPAPVNAELLTKLKKLEQLSKEGKPTIVSSGQEHREVQELLDEHAAEGKKFSLY